MITGLTEYEAEILFWLRWCAGALTIIAGSVFTIVVLQ